LENDERTMIDILNRTKLFEILSKLETADQPEFGAMSPQQMEEHLAFAVRFSNGKEPQQYCYPPDKERCICNKR
jgi:hypothetical protein